LILNRVFSTLCKISEAIIPVGIFLGGTMMTAESLRSKTFADLKTLGFRPAKSLPLLDVDAVLRPIPEIAARLLALDALFTWVVFDEESVESERVEKYIKRNRLQDAMTASEAAIIDLPREEAHENHKDTIGWRLENMWALAWVLGFDPEPDLEADQINSEVSRAMIDDFLPGLEGTTKILVKKSEPREVSDVIAMEYRFYCAHNAVRSAQLGGDTVPEGFHPIIHGGAVHERRHSLTWCLAPSIPWDDTDLST
jgi:hypothetical protein